MKRFGWLPALFLADSYSCTDRAGSSGSKKIRVQAGLLILGLLRRGRIPLSHAFFPTFRIARQMRAELCHYLRRLAEQIFANSLTHDGTDPDYLQAKVLAPMVGFNDCGD
jgi:hypothetical protein